MKARDRQTVAVLRSALAAIDNAEAVEATSTPPRVEPGPAPGGGDAGAPERATHLTGPAPAPGTPPVAEAGPAAPTATPVAEAGSVAGASPVAEAGSVAGAVIGLGAGEVERRSLTAGEMESIVQQEVAERRTAARAYEDAGQSHHAERLQAEADLLSSYLRNPGPAA